MRHNILDNSENRTNEELQSNGSSGHDPLCPPNWWLPGDDVPCAFCGLIAKVRADERHRFDDDGADSDIREQAIRDAAGEAALALLAMDGVEFTPEQHNSVVDAILALQEKS